MHVLFLQYYVSIFSMIQLNFMLPLTYRWYNIKRIRNSMMSLIQSFMIYLYLLIYLYLFIYYHDLFILSILAFEKVFVEIFLSVFNIHSISPYTTNGAFNCFSISVNLKKILHYLEILLSVELRIYNNSDKWLDSYIVLLYTHFSSI